ncbi:hypothetical protein Lalb_Chr03g0040791 [Lupinus albus]|uniref:Uncharacterized protein n=1 Tax=Lupinus albus TaxID=3870 RepID=A0A6A4QUZ9_LUPAL|nr:hypothetical protein Lalb_Chr03g0040791 [Lupinus albus]
MQIGEIREESEKNWESENTRERDSRDSSSSAPLFSVSTRRPPWFNHVLITSPFRSLSHFLV